MKKTAFLLAATLLAPAAAVHAENIALPAPPSPAIFQERMQQIYEAGKPCWTPLMPQEFAQRRGYTPEFRPKTY